ncbi:hypothetical protein, partial [Rhizobium leguminosarum]|uniref:hypothetical protein n=1 Tax=Rhizobium leguminosarum TaxID=384 RepID=UPI003F945BDB
MPCHRILGADVSLTGWDIHELCPDVLFEGGAAKGQRSLEDCQPPFEIIPDIRLDLVDRRRAADRKRGADALLQRL